MRRKARPGGGRQAEVTIESIGGRGDAQASLDGRPVFLEQALPGERVRLRTISETAAGLRAELVELLEPSPERVVPPCPRFGPCGGCALQHWAEAPYRTWKRERVVRAVARALRDPERAESLVAPLTADRPRTRRRASLAAERLADGTLRLGFRGRRSHEVVPAEGCLILAPGLYALLEPLGAALGLLLEPGSGAQLHAALTESGPDVLLELPVEPDLAAREALVSLADAADLARLSWRPAGPRSAGFEPEPVALRRAPRLTFGQLVVEPPPGAFLQASVTGEASLRRVVEEAGRDVTGRRLDLFAGIGTFSGTLLEGGPVHAVEGDGAAVVALSGGARASGLGGRLTVEGRDLEARPLISQELRGYDLAVIDPPRAGARAQHEAMALSGISRVIGISCNPNTFARDARILIEGGFQLRKVLPLDQFLWSPHVELVAIFER